MKVLLAVASLTPAYGGPAVSVSQLGRALAQAGARVGLWAPDGSASTSALVEGPVERLTGAAAQVLDAFRPDLIHDNGIWLPHNHALAGRRTVRLVSPRGMLEPWARSHKRLKKALAWGLYQRADLRKAAALHATAEAEAANLERLKLSPPIRVIPNGVDLPTLRATEKPPIRTALFLGRIYPVKGLPMLIEAWARVRPEGWRLRIAGPDEADHRAEVERAVRAAGLGAVVDFLGPLAGEAKHAAFEEADLFILPSHSESFGMAVGEALAHGVPVLTTRAAPWPMLEARGCGWWADPEPQAIAAALATATSQDRAALRAMGERGRALIAEQYSWDSVAQAFLALYEDIAA